MMNSTTWLEEESHRQAEAGIDGGRQDHGEHGSAHGQDDAGNRQAAAQQASHSRRLRRPRATISGMTRPIPGTSHSAG
jgi:hypothetical protein